jgi:hypothetical protein
LSSGCSETPRRVPCFCFWFEVNRSKSCFRLREERRAERRGIAAVGRLTVDSRGLIIRRGERRQCQHQRFMRRTIEKGGKKKTQTQAQTQRGI